MARERWFFAQGNQRRGPLPFSQLVESVLAQPDPRAVLVWRKGFSNWTRGEDVPEVERRIASLLAKRDAEEAVRRAPPPEPVAPVPPPRPPLRDSPALVYGALGAVALLVIGIAAWLVWGRPQPSPAVPVPLGGTTTENAPAVVIPAPASSSPGPATPAPPASGRPAPESVPKRAPASRGVAGRESDLPAADLRKLRGVAAWSGDTLKLTVYNGTNWRVTEIYVRIGRFAGDDFVDDPQPVLLLPPGGQVDSGVADLMNRVAPDRKRAGLNSLDTGPFEGRAGMQPENFRWVIETARGYPPE